tara:strand:+ start:1133 stop:1396 length:264 start_codon:yes stop_codon:yes gene_type:complete
MDKKTSFGGLSAQELKIGDIVEWSKWDGNQSNWESNYGIITEIKNEVKGNRLVSVSMVMPLAGPQMELEFFTPSLKLVSRAESLDNL